MERLAGLICQGNFVVSFSARGGLHAGPGAARAGGFGSASMATDYDGNVVI